MSVPHSAADFLELLQRSSLIEHAQLQTLCAEQAALFAEGVSALECARGLVERQMITAYQARLLLAGRHKGFYVGKYKVLELLGRGGMGHVFLAEQVAMQRLVAIKVVNRPVSPESETYSRFIREARAIAALRHPNIIQAFDFDETSDGVPYIVMEYIEGLDIARQVSRFGPISPELTADYISQAADGLQHAHERGFVHRDIKPGNLLVDAAGALRLLDLGLVSEAEQINEEGHLTSEDGYLGTLDYIAPEQALDSRSADIRSDIYSLGAVSYFALSGQQLFPRSSAAQKLLFHQAQEPTPLSELRPTLPQELCDIVHRMLAKDPADRFQTPGEVKAAVEPFAKRTIPPYDVRAIGYSRDRMDRFLRHSPSSAGLSSSGLSASSLSPTGLPLPSGDGSSGSSGGSDRRLPEASLSDSSASGLVFVDAPLPSELPKLSDQDTDDSGVVDEDSHYHYQSGSVIDHGYSEMQGVRDIPTFESLQQGQPDPFAAPTSRRWPAAVAVVGLLACAGGLAWHFSDRASGDTPTVPGGELVAASDNDPGEQDIGPSDPSEGTPAEEPDGTDNPPSDIENGNSQPETVGTQIAAVPGTGGESTTDPPNVPHDAVVENPSTRVTIPPIDVALPRETPLDQMQFEDIDAYEYTIATRGVGGTLKGLVGIFGDSRLTHWNAVTAVAWSPDGSMIASASDDLTIRLWNPETGHQDRVLHSGAPRTTALSFSRDGRKLAVGDADGFVAVFDIVSRRRIWREKLERGMPNALEFSPDHRDLFVTCRAVWKLHVFDAAMGEVARTTSLGESPYSMRLNAAGTQVAVGLRDGTVLVRNVAERSLVYRMDLHTSPVTTLRFSPDDTHLMSVAKEDYQSAIWDLSDGTLRQSLEFNEPPHEATFTTDSRHVMTAVGWPLKYDDLDAPADGVIGYGHAGTTRAMAVSPDRNWLITAAEDHHLRVWNARRPDRRFAGSPQEWGIYNVAVSGDGKLLITGDLRLGRVWDVASRTLKHDIRQINGPMRACAISPDGRFIAGGGGYENQFRIWDAETLDRQHQIQTGSRLHAATFSPDSTRVALAMLKAGSNYPIQTVWIYNPVSGEPTVQLQDAEPDSNGRDLAYSRDGNTVAGAGTNSIVLWDAQSGEVVQRLVVPEEATTGDTQVKPNTRNWFSSVAYAPGGSHVLASRRDGSIHLWNTSDGEYVRTLFAGEHPSECAAISPDGRFAAWGMNDGCLYLLSLTDVEAEPRKVRIGPENGVIFDIAFGPAARHVLTANGNGTVYVLRLEDIL